MSAARPSASSDHGPRFCVLLALIAFLGAPEVKADDVPFLVTRLDIYLYDENKAPNADYFAGAEHGVRPLLVRC